MEIVIQATPEKASAVAACIVADLVRRKPESVLGLATGRSPVLLYRELARKHREEGLDFSGVTTFNLDEYVGIAPEHPASYRAFMWKHLFAMINVSPERINIPDGMAQDIPAFCEEYESRIRRAGGVDLQILGIGADGHIGFNEPSSSMASRTRIKTLTPETRRDNAPFFEAQQVPNHVITMGIGTILESRTVLLLAFGSAKAQIVAQAVEGPLCAMIPASALHLHRDAKVILDEEAASGLSRADYYRYVYDHKPQWQQYR